MKGPSNYPKLYWHDHCRPGTDWLKFTRKQIPKDRPWTSLEEEESFSSWIALPGLLEFYNTNGIVYSFIAQCSILLYKVSIGLRIDMNVTKGIKIT